MPLDIKALLKKFKFKDNWRPKNWSTGLRHGEVPELKRKFGDEEGCGGNQMAMALALEQNYDSDLMTLSSLPQLTLNLCNAEERC